MTAPPDASTLSTWEDAFVHPIPTVRALERQLQTELAASKESLRGLVGESYRDLLRTAERIVEMDRDAQSLEESLAGMSRNCSARLMERKARNLRVFEEKVGAEDREKYIYAAQLAVLGSCPSVITRLLQKDDGEGCLKATKVLVVMRLLINSLLQKGPPIPLLETLKSQRTTLTTTLTSHLDRLLTTPTLTLPPLTSYSLLKTTSPTPLLSHLLFLRSSTLSSLLSAPTPQSTLQALTLYNATLSQADALFPKRLSDSLVLLKSRPLLSDPEIAEIAELGLDTNGRWLPEEVVGFVPWVRHDDLERAKVVEVVGGWAEREFLVVCEGIERTLKEMGELEEIVKLRAELLSLWRAGSRGRRPFNPDDDEAGAERFRELVGARITQVLREKSQGLEEVGTKIKEELENSDGALEGSTSLWDPFLLTIPLTSGGALFKESVQSRVHGKNTAIKRVRAVYDSYLSTIASTTATLQNLRSQTTLTSTSDDDDDFDAEEQRAQEALEDATIAETELKSALDTAYRALEAHIESLLDPPTTNTPAPTTTHHKSTFLLRTIRQIRQHPDPLLPLPWFGSTLIPRLHGSIAAAVARGPLDTIAHLLEKRKWSGELASRALWEGTPPLPGQPSPLVFKFLHELVGDMHKAGDDVWTPAAVRGVKVRAAQELWGALERVLKGREIGEIGEKAQKEEEALVEAIPASVPDATADEGGDKEAPTPADAEASPKDPDTDANHETAAETAEASTASTTETPVAPETPEPAPEAEDSDHRIIGMDWAVQLLFDALYLDEALQRKGANVRSSGISSLAGKIEAAIGIRLGFDEELRRRLEGSAREYWKRTCLLFGLLA